MSAHATRLRHHGMETATRPVEGVPCTIEVINLDGHPTLRVTQGRYGIGYFASPEDAAAAGVDLATAVVKGDR